MYIMLSIMVSLVVVYWYLVYYKSKTKFSWERSSNRNKLIAGIALAVVIPLGTFIGFEYANYADTEILSGRVVSKERETVSCSHSYEICTKSGDVSTCVTYYKHAHDYDWIVHTTVGDIEISRVDEQGVHEPKRWTAVKLGENAFVEHLYQNYIKGTDDSIFNKEEMQSSKAPPQYPYTFDYYRHNPVIDQTGTVDDKTKEMVKDINSDYGASKQIHVILIVTKQDYAYFDTVYHAWGGLKKNDLLLMYGLNDDGSLSWFNAATYADSYKNHEAMETLKSEITEVDYPKQVLRAVQLYNRVPMAEFEHLKEEYSSPWYVYVFTLMFFPVILFTMSKVQ